MSAINALIETVAALRDPKTGCPWDIEQDHQSISDCLIDECCELLQTIDRLDLEHMEEELGDVLLQVIMHAQMGREAGNFDFESICEGINAKLIRRHPHVFGDASVKDSEALLEQWEAIKASEKKNGPENKGPFKDLPLQLPSLMFAEDVFKQIQKKQIETKGLVDLSSIESRATDLNTESLGKELFELVAACRLRGFDAESHLRRYTQQLMDDLSKD